MIHKILFVICTVLFLESAAFANKIGTEHLECIPTLGLNPSVKNIEILYRSGFNAVVISYLKTKDNIPRALVVSTSYNEINKTMMEVWQEIPGNFIFLDEALVTTEDKFTSLFVKIPEIQDIDMIVNMVSRTSRNINSIIPIFPSSMLHLSEGVKLWKSLVPGSAVIVEFDSYQIAHSNNNRNISKKAREDGVDFIIIPYKELNDDMLRAAAWFDIHVGVSGVNSKNEMEHIISDAKSSFFLTDYPYVYLDYKSSKYVESPHSAAAIFYSK